MLMTKKTFIFLSSFAIALCFAYSCDDKQNNKTDPSTTLTVAAKSRDRNNWWYCPDNVKGFPPVNIKLWNKVPVVNGRPPTHEETLNGTSLIYYGLTTDTATKPYNMLLPKLASFFDPNTNKTDTVIVIQIVQTTYDTIVGYRYLTGGNGTHDFRDFHILTDTEVKKAVGQK